MCLCVSKGWCAFVTLPHTVTPYRDSADGTCDHVMYQKLVHGNIMGMFSALSVFGHHIKEMIWLRPVQVWTCNVKHHVRFSHLLSVPDVSVLKSGVNL
jgi:hypothetical protein